MYFCTFLNIFYTDPIKSLIVESKDIKTGSRHRLISFSRWKVYCCKNSADHWQGKYFIYFHHLYLYFPQDCTLSLIFSVPTSCAPWTNQLLRHHNKMLSSKKLTCKGQVFIRVYGLDWTVSHDGIFDSVLWTIVPLTFSLVHPPPSRTSLSQSTVHTDSVWLGGGWGVLSCAGDHILQEFDALFLTRFRTYKISLPPQPKT